MIYSAAALQFAWILAVWMLGQRAILAHEMARVGWAMVAIDLASAAWIFTAWRLFPRSEDVGAVPLDAEEDLRDEPASAAIELGAETAGAKAIMILLTELVMSDPSTIPPLVRLIRCGPRGIEVLLAEACADAPAAFVVEAEGLIWRLTTPIEEVLVQHRHDGVDCPEPVEIGSDADGTYFAPGGSALAPSLWRVGEDAPPSVDDHFQEAMPGEMGFDQRPYGSLHVASYADYLVLEPFGLELAPPRSTDHIPDPRDHGEFDLDIQSDGDRTEALPTDDESQHGSWDESEVAFDEGHRQEMRSAEMKSAETESEQVQSEEERSEQTLSLVPPARVEVRILQEIPDIVGELLQEPSEAAIEFVAYLATHGNRVSTVRLRDALGAERGRPSVSGKSVWTAAGSARRSLGIDLVPQASGNQPYSLSSEVSSDWARFGELVALATIVDAERTLAVRALTEALELVHGVPARSSRRFDWLDVEHLIGEISRKVVGVAVLLVDLAIAIGDLELAHFAIAKGRILEPDAEALLQAELIVTSRHLDDAVVLSH